MKFVQDTSILSALIRFDNGTTAHVAGTGVGREIELVCTNGVIRVVNDGEAVQMRRRDTASDVWDEVPVEQIPPRSGTVHLIRDLIQSIKTGQPGKSNLRVTLLSQDIGFGIYESHLRGGMPVSPPIPNRERWVSSW